MTRDKLMEVLWQVWNQEAFPESAMAAVDAYASSVNEGKQDGGAFLPPDKIWLLKEIAHPYIYETAEEGTYSIATQGIEKIIEYYERMKQKK